MSGAAGRGCFGGHGVPPDVVVLFSVPSVHHARSRRILSLEERPLGRNVLELRARDSVPANLNFAEQVLCELRRINLLPRIIHERSGGLRSACGEADQYPRNAANSPHIDSNHSKSLPPIHQRNSAS